MKKLLIASILLSAASTVTAVPFPDGNAETGKQIFDRHNCNRCHANMLGGDGNTMFTRPNRKIHSAPDLNAQIKRCNSATRSKLTPQDEQHIAAYLNRFYQFQ